MSNSVKRILITCLLAMPWNKVIIESLKKAPALRSHSKGTIVGKSSKYHFCAISLFTVLSVSTVAAATEWLPYQDNLKPSASQSLNKASLSPEIKISKPDSNLPPNISFYSGVWKGSMCNGFSEVIIAVKELAIEGASIVYSLGNYVGTFNNQEYKASILDGELTGRTKTGIEVILAKRTKDEYLNIKWIRGDDKQQSASTQPLICYGVLKREQ